MSAVSLAVYFAIEDSLGWHHRLPLTLEHFLEAGYTAGVHGRGTWQNWPPLSQFQQFFYFCKGHGISAVAPAVYFLIGNSLGWPPDLLKGVPHGEVHGRVHGRSTWQGYMAEFATPITVSAVF